MWNFTSRKSQWLLCYHIFILVTLRLNGRAYMLSNYPSTYILWGIWNRSSRTNFVDVTLCFFYTNFLENSTNCEHNFNAWLHKMNISTLCSRFKSKVFQCVLKFVHGQIVRAKKSLLRQVVCFTKRKILK